MYVRFLFAFPLLFCSILCGEFSGPDRSRAYVRASWIVSFDLIYGMQPKEKDKLKNLTAEQMEDLKRQQMVMFQKARSSLSCSQQSATSNKSTDSHASQETANRSEKKELEDEEDIEMDEYSDHDDGEPDADGDESAPTSSMRQSTGGLDVEDDDYDFDDEE